MDAFSVPRRGIHSYRVFDVAVVDVLLTVILARWLSRTYFFAVLAGLLLLSVIVHTRMGIRTKTNGGLLP